MSDPRTELAHHLRAAATDLAAMHVTTGFDAFIDELITVVEERSAIDAFEPIHDMKRFSEVISQAAGRSSLREIVIGSVDAGGCALNLGEGLLGLGVRLEYFGTTGRPPHPAFGDFLARCFSHTALDCDPGRTLAMEFANGKYMLSAVSQLARLDAACMQGSLADGAYRAACERSPLIALTNWTLYPHMTDCWQLLQREVYAHLTHRPWFFIDLVDPRSRSRQDIMKMLDVLPGFESAGPTVFGGNLNEANAVADCLGIAHADEDEAAVADQAAAIRAKLGITQVVTHCIRLAAMADADTTASAQGPWCPKPLKSTGAGDRFNAGYCAGLLLKLPARQRLLLGKACSGFFVRNARSGSIEEVAGLLDRWSAGTLDEA